MDAQPIASVSSKWRAIDRPWTAAVTGVRSPGERAGSRASQYLLQIAAAAAAVVVSAADADCGARPASSARARVAADRLRIRGLGRRVMGPLCQGNAPEPFPWNRSRSFADDTGASEGGGCGNEHESALGR
jgi:hypothetical protein